MVLGDSKVGKTNIIHRFTSNEFNLEPKPTIGLEYHAKTLQIESDIAKVHIWDTAGQDVLKAVTSQFYCGAMCALIVYDITQEATFKNVPKWLKDLRDFAHPEVVTILVGNKCDLTNLRQVEFMRGKMMAEDLKMNKFLETSALENINIETVFFDAIGSMHRAGSC